MRLGSEAEKDLKQILGSEGEYSLDPSDLSHFGKDWSGLVDPNPSVIVFPKTTAAVARVMKYCFERKIPVVPSGGRTGLSGGAIAAQGEWVLSLSKMNRMEKVDVLSRTVRVQAGAVTEAVHDHCRPKGLTWPVDFASKGSSQVGGNIATNAGGVRVIRYGNTRNWVLSIQAVQMDGTVLELNGDLEKNNTGYDLRQLLVGSEGTLAVITEATLKLCPLEENVEVGLFRCRDLSQVIELFQATRVAGFPVMAFETLSAACLSESTKFLNQAAPFSLEGWGAQGFVVLCEAMNADGLLVHEKWVEFLESGLAEDAVVAQNPKQKSEFWALRESVAEAVFAGTGHGVHAGAWVYQHDVSVPIPSLTDFSKKLLAKYAADYPEFEIFLFGHIGDGNLHVFIRSKPAAGLTKEEFVQRCKSSDQHLFKFIQDFKGSVSAEHGIGLLKKNALPYSRPAHEIALMKGIKKAFDPSHLLNPGKLL
ncbi:MAG: FAD-binding oxidoreductase [Bdellovibrionales bacterium]|nr:FAD-binding oxidoreductase [Bdellovibrionales bacterium]